MSEPTKIQDFVEYWQSHMCPDCETENWTYHSHSQRHYTGHFLNTNACRCWKCKCEYWLCEDCGECPEIQDGNPTSSLLR